jgi:hypothetical protein
LKTLVVEKFYALSASAGEVQRWQGRRVLGSEGTMSNLPDTAATRAQYTSTTLSQLEFACAVPINEFQVDQFADGGTAQPFAHPAMDLR